MDPLVENEAKLHITNGIEKASSVTGVDIKVSAFLVRSLTLSVFVRIASLQTSERVDGQAVWALVPLRHGRRLQFRGHSSSQSISVPLLLRQARCASIQVLKSQLLLALCVSLSDRVDQLQNIRGAEEWLWTLHREVCVCLRWHLNTLCCGV